MTTVESVTLATAVVGAVTGLVGTGLAIWSLWRQINQDKVKLRVGVRWGLATHSPSTPFLVISVTNLSAFPVTVCEVGLLIPDGKQRAISMDARTSNGQGLPQRMEPRTSVSVYFPPDFLRDPSLRSAKYAYAATDCGEQVTSSGDAVRKMIAEAQRAVNP